MGFMAELWQLSWLITTYRLTMVWFMIDVSNWLILVDGVYTPNQKLKHMFQKLWKTRFVLSSVYDRVMELIFMAFVKQQTSLGGHHHFLIFFAMEIHGFLLVSWSKNGGCQWMTSTSWVFLSMTTSETWWFWYENGGLNGIESYWTIIFYHTW